MRGGEESNQMNLRSNKQYAKIAAIPVLAIVLYTVFPRTEKVATLDKNDSQRGRLEDQTRVRVPNSTATMRKEKRPEWPIFDSSDILTIDPFDKRMIFPESAVSTTQDGPSDASQQKLVSSPSLTQQATKVSDVKIQAIFRSSRGIAALVDTRLIQVGDRLNDGSEVIEITPEQLIVVVPKVE
jgi:hypothetical protein